MSDLKQLIADGRSTTIDWLDDDASTETIAEVLSAMANSNGGKLIIGVREGEIDGVANSIHTVDRVVAASLSLDPPLIMSLPTVEKIDNKTVVVTHIPDGLSGVYAINGRFLHRRQISSTVMRPIELRQLFLERGEINFESGVLPTATLDDLDWQKVGSYIKETGLFNTLDPRDVLLQRGCLIRYGDALCPTHAGILLFGKNPQRYLQGAEITAVRFAGKNMSDTFSRQDITGTLPDQIRKAETFLIDHLRKGVKLHSAMEREEQFEYPMEAARELVVNAVAHRDYSINGDNIRLFLFKDRMEVSSPGKLAGQITVENIKDERFSRNPVIVQVLSDMGFIERLGYGVDRVIELMKQQNLREPEFCETAIGFRASLYNQQADDLLSENISHEPENVDIAINPRQEAAINYLKESGHTRITNSELQRMYPDVHAETIRRDLADLVTKNILSKMGQKRGSYYVLRKDEDRLG